MIYFFLLIKPKDVDHIASWDYKNIEGCHSMHFLVSISHQDCILLNVKELACFCADCMDDNSNFYEMKSRVQPWRLLTLEPFNMSQVPSSNFKVFLFMVSLFVHICWKKIATTRKCGFSKSQLD